MRPARTDARTDGPAGARERSRLTARGPGRRAVVPSSVLWLVLLAVLSLGTVLVGGTATAGAGADVGSVAAVPAVAQADAGTGTDGSGGVGPGPRICDRNASTFVRVFNGQVDSVPGVVRDRIRDSDVHLRVFGTAGGSYTMVTDDQSQVSSYSEGKPASPSIRVETDCETFRAITDAGDPGARFRTAYENDEVRFVGLTPVDRVLFTGIALLSDPVSLAVVLLVLLLLLVAVYVLYRRLSVHYRGGEPGVDPEE